MSRQPVAATIAIVALAALVVLGGVTGSTAARVPPPRLTTAPITSATLVCPNIDGAAMATTTRAIVADLAGALTPPSQSTGTVTATVLARKKSTKSPLSLVPAAVINSRPKVDETVAIGATGSVAASLVADQIGLTTTGRHRGLSGVGCVAPATDWWFAGADGRVGFTDVLTLANPAPTAADVTVSLWGPKGPLAATTLQAVRVHAMSVMHLKIASVAPDTPTIAVHVHASSGAVTAAVFHSRITALQSDGTDFMPATDPPSRSAVVAGFAAGLGARRLILADPGALSATVSVRLVTRTGSFAPAGDNQIVVPAGHTRAIDLDKAFGGTTGAVELTSDQPVIAQGLSVTPAKGGRPDLMWLAATPPLVGSAGIADGRELTGGHCLLLLSAPQGTAQVRVTTPAGGSSLITVAAGRSVSVDVTTAIQPRAGEPGGGAWPFVVTTVGSAPVYGVRVLQFAGPHGALITDQPLLALPTPTVLPVVRQDPRIATR